MEIKIQKEKVLDLVKEYGEQRTEMDLGGYIAVIDYNGLIELKKVY